MEKVYNTKCKYLNLCRYCDHKQIDKMFTNLNYDSIYHSINYYN